MNNLFSSSKSVANTLIGQLLYDFENDGSINNDFISDFSLLYIENYAKECDGKDSGDTYWKLYKGRKATILNESLIEESNVPKKQEILVSEIADLDNQNALVPEERNPFKKIWKKLMDKFKGKERDDN